MQSFDPPPDLLTQPEFKLTGRNNDEKQKTTSENDSAAELIPELHKEAHQEVQEDFREPRSQGFAPEDSLPTLVAPMDQTMGTTSEAPLYTTNDEFLNQFESPPQPGHSGSRTGGEEEPDTPLDSNPAIWSGGGFQKKHHVGQLPHHQAGLDAQIEAQLAYMRSSRRPNIFKRLFLLSFLASTGFSALGVLLFFSLSQLDKEQWTELLGDYLGPQLTHSLTQSFEEMQKGLDTIKRLRGIEVSEKPKDSYRETFGPSAQRSSTSTSTSLKTQKKLPVAQAVPQVISTAKPSVPSIIATPIATPQFTGRQASSPYWKLPNTLETHPEPMRRLWVDQESSWFRRGLEHKFHFQHYKTVLEVRRARLKGSDVILWEALEDKKLWTRMYAVIALAEFGIDVSLAVVEKALGDEPSSRVAHFFKRFQVDKKGMASPSQFTPQLTPGEIYILKQAIRLVDGRGRAEILQALNLLESPSTAPYFAAALYDTAPSVKKWLRNTRWRQNIPLEQLNALRIQVSSH